MSEDAAMMVRMWKEKRLAEMFDNTDSEHGVEDDGEIIEKEYKKDTTVVFVKKGEITVEKDIIKNKIKSVKIEILCCSVM